MMEWQWNFYSKKMDLCNDNLPVIRALRDEWIENVWLKFVKEFAETRNFPIKWIIKNPNVTLDFIDKHPEFDWTYCEISENPNLTYEYVKTHGLNVGWNWYALSKHKNITLDIIKHTYRSKRYNRWIMTQVVKNPNVSMTALQSRRFFTNSRDWCWKDVVHNPNITIPCLIGTTFNEHMYNSLIFSKNIPVNYVLNIGMSIWHFMHICKNPTIGKNITDEQFELKFPMEDVRQFRQRITCMYGTMNEVMEYLQDPPQHFGWAIMSKNEHLTIDFVQKYKSCSLLCAEVLCNEMKDDKNAYITHHLKIILLLHMYENRDTLFHKTNFEKVIADEYMLKMLLQY
jgi:hypothetical protein